MAERPAKPNILILFTDDMGYGDLSSYGNPVIETPNIDRLADQGIRFTSFVTANWCVPSRTQLLTGRYMSRIDFGGATGAGGKGGLPDSVLTLAEGLNEAGYATGMVGKWHLGYAEDKFLPPNQGFDSWFGLPYSNDYRKPWVQTDVPLGFYEGTEMVEHPINQDSITVRYTRRSVQFIREEAKNERPFFFYLAYNMPHLPIHTTSRFQGKSGAGLYGDVVETIDWSVGEILSELERQGISDNTIVFFASDNGPWLNLPDRMLQAGNKPWHAGSPGILRGSKATTFEGGHRVPAIIRWPGHIKSNQDSDVLIASPDIYRTFLEVANAKHPDLPIDGYNYLPYLTGEADQPPRNEYAYFRGNRLEGLRVGNWKLRITADDTALFNVQIDPGERFNRVSTNPDIFNKIFNRMKELTREIEGTYIGRKEKKTDSDE